MKERKERIELKKHNYFSIFIKRGEIKKIRNKNGKQKNTNTNCKLL